MKLIKREKEICKELDITPKTLRAWIRAGTFPAPLPIGRGRKRMWSAHQVERVLRGEKVEA
jgi:DNA-binding transcriptional MerR regulator